MKNLIFLLTVTSIFYACSQDTHIPHIIEKPVPIKNSTDRSWKQGWLCVKENRSNTKSSLIEIPFILSKASDSLKENNTPILVMSGGPGNSSIHMGNGVVNTIWGESSDVLVLDQRGTRYTNPALVCPEIDSLRIMGLKKGLYGKALDSLKMLGIKLSYDRLTSQNIDLNGYNTLESVEDIEDLRKALKIEKFILYGMSYSCNLMMTYAQTYPAHVKAVILDSPLPHHVNYDEDGYNNIDNTLSRIVKHYTGNSELYSNWKDHIHSIEDSVYSLSANNIIYHYTKNELIDIVLFKMSGHNSLPDVTNAIQRIINGNHEDIVDIIHYYLENTQQALGMRYSVWVSEELPEEQLTNVTQNKQQYSWLKDYPVNDVNHQTAKYWKVNSIYKNSSWPTSIYNGPTLILSGQFDPWTPKWYGKEMLKYAPNGKHVIFKNTTHLPGFTEDGFNAINEFIKKL